MTTKFTPAWLEGHRVDVSSLTRTDVVGIGHVLAEIDALVARLRDPQRAAAMGLEPPRGILLWGGPGLGKTLVARYLGASLGAGVPFYEVSADELTPERIRGALRHLATAHPRSILYADEIDTIGMSRDYGGHDPDTRMRLTALLAALDGVTATDGPVVIASSNRPPHQLDLALTRSGRLGFKVRFDTPDEDERVELFRLFTRAIPSGPGIDWRHAARLTRGKSPADLRQVVEDAAGLALASDRDAIAAPDILAAIRRDGRIEPEPDGIAEVIHRTAVHEAGHVAACVALRGGAWVYSVRIGTTDGHTSFGDERLSRAMRPDDEVRDALVIAFAGIAAERAVLGDPASGGASDVAAATTIALERIRAGLTDEATPLDLEQLEGDVAEALKTEWAVDLANQVMAARERAVAIVEASVEPLRRFAGLLEAAGELTGEALAEAIEGAGFSRGADA
jgi:cell division protease FtsH